MLGARVRVRSKYVLVSGAWMWVLLLLLLLKLSELRVCGCNGESVVAGEQASGRQSGRTLELGRRSSLDEATATAGPQERRRQKLVGSVAKIRGQRWGWGLLR